MNSLLNKQKIEDARTKHAIQAAIEMGAGNYSKAIEYAESVANAPINDFNQPVIAGAQLVLGYSYLAKKNRKKAILWFQKSCKNSKSDSYEMLEEIKK